MKADEIKNLRRKFAGKSILLMGLPFSPLEKFTYYTVYNFLQRNEECAIWVSTDFPHQKVESRFADYGYGLRKFEKRVYFIDILSQKAGVYKGYKSERCIYIQDPNNLTELSLSITELIKKLKCGLIVIDSLNSLLLYNELAKTLQFLRFLSAQIYEKGILLLNVLIEGEHDLKAETSLQITADAVFKISENKLKIMSGLGTHTIRLRL